MALDTQTTPEEQLAFTQSVLAVAEQMSKEHWPSESITPAMDFVLLHAVNVDAATVMSDDNNYHIKPVEGCPCKAAQYSSSRYCKHFVALEMAKRVNTYMTGDDMPTSNPQSDWEAGVQSGQGPESTPLFDKEQPEPDDIPEPNTPEVAMSHPLEGHNPAPYATQVLYTEGHQYVDHPSTLCIKRHIGMTEVMWTFRGEHDGEVWTRASQMIRTIDEMAKRYAPPAPPPVMPPPPTAGPGLAPPAPPPSPPAQPQQTAGGERAVNHGVLDTSPYCAVHSVHFESWTKGNRQWFAHKTPEGGFCNAPR